MVMRARVRVVGKGREKEEGALVVGLVLLRAWITSMTFVDVTAASPERSNPLSRGVRVPWEQALKIVDSPWRKKVHMS